MGKRWLKPEPPRPCDRKKRYSTYEEAVAMAVIRTSSDREPPPLLTAYRCNHCNGFHLSSEVSRTGRFPAITA